MLKYAEYFHSNIFRFLTEQPKTIKSKFRQFSTSVGILHIFGEIIYDKNIAWMLIASGWRIDLSIIFMYDCDNTELSRLRNQ